MCGNDQSTLTDMYENHITKPVISHSEFTLVRIKERKRKGSYGGSTIPRSWSLCARWSWRRRVFLHQCSQAPPNQEHVSSLGAQYEGGRFKLRNREGYA